MDHINRVRRAIDFIERHLREELKAETVAGAVHYSVSHFHIVFAKVTGSTLADYIRKRRLAYAALELALSDKGIINLAMEYQFGSQETFTRAFKRTYGITPGAFRKNRNYAEALRRLGVHRSKLLIMKGERIMAENGPSSKILKGVMRVGYYRGGDQCPEDIPFPSCLASCLRFLGEEYPWIPLKAHNMNWRLNTANVEILGATGMAFGLLWRKGWHMDNADMMFVANPREVIHRAFTHLGYNYELVKKSGPDDAPLFKQKIVQSINAGRPVLAFGVIGPPECCIITGYDSEGDILVGWSYFQDDPQWAAGVETTQEGYFRKADWFNDTLSLLLIGDKRKDGDERRNIKETLKWALQVARTPKVFERSSGIAAYDAWIN